MYKQGKQIVIYASKTLAGSKLKYSSYKKVLLATVWQDNNFQNYFGGLKTVDTSTSHLP